MNIDDRAIPITFMDFRNRYKIDKTIFSDSSNTKFYQIDMENI